MRLDACSWQNGPRDAWLHRSPGAAEGAHHGGWKTQRHTTTKKQTPNNNYTKKSQESSTGTGDGGGENEGASGVHAQMEVVNPSYARKRCCAHFPWRSCAAVFAESGPFLLQLQLYIEQTAAGVQCFITSLGIALCVYTLIKF